MNLLSESSKTGYSINWNHNTCKPDCPLGVNGDRSCYGLKGPIAWPSAKKANAARLTAYKADPIAYFSQLKAEILRKRKPLEHVRVNGNGDTPDRRWVDFFIQMAKETPNVKYWVATRYFEYWRGVELPNVVVRFSVGVPTLKGERSSTVTLDKASATCPATVKGSGIHDCATCGYKCWAKDEMTVAYAKH